MDDDMRAAEDAYERDEREAREERTVACSTGVHAQCNGIGNDESGEFYCNCPCHQGG